MLSHNNRDVGLASALACLSGFVDAVGFLSLGGFFVSFMSGNTTLVKMGQSMARRLVGEPSTAWRRYLALWASMGIGSTLGGLSYLRAGFESVYVAAAIAALAAVVAARLHL